MFEHLAGLLLFGGFFLLVGTAGASDYADEMGVYWNIADYIPQMVIGVLMMFLGSGIASRMDFEEMEEGEQNAD